MISNGYIVKWGGRMFLIEHPNIAMRRRKVEIREHFDGEITIKFNERYLKYREVTEPKPAAREMLKRPVNESRKRKGKYIPPPDHPWRRHNPSLHHNSYLERVI
jgi:hypothetical protein